MNSIQVVCAGASSRLVRRHRGSRAARALLVGLLVVAPALASAAPRIAVGTVVRGSRQLDQQVRGALCASYECVPGAFLANGRPDWAKVRQHGVSGVVVSSVWKDAKGQSLSVALLGSNKQQLRSFSIPLVKGLLTVDGARQLVTGVEAQFGAGAAARPPPVAAAPAPRPAAPPPPPAEPAPQVIEEEEPPPPPPVRSRPAPAAREAEPVLSSGEHPWRYAFEAGGDVLHRSLTYGGVTAASSLMGLKANLFALRLRGEAYPLASGPGPTTGPGAFLDVAFSIGQKTKEDASGTVLNHNTQYSRIQAGVAWRAALGPVVLAPAVSYQMLGYTVAKAGGVAVTGLPDSKLSGFKVGLDAELPLGSLTLLGGLGYVKWTKATDLVSPSFFPSGSAAAFEGELGLDWAFSRMLSARVVGEYSGTGYSLKPGVNYTATTAADIYLGARVMLRAQF
jgi:hypothetical protein